MGARGKKFKDEKIIKLQKEMTAGGGRIRQTSSLEFWNRRDELDRRFMSDPNTRKEFDTLRAIKKMQS